MMRQLRAWLMRGPSFNQRMEDCGGYSRGFDYLRIGLSLLVLSWHGVKSLAGPQAERAILNGPWHAAICLILPMFFALSGFLVCGSLERTRGLLPFAAHRVLRLVPALAVEIALSALLLGPIMTNMSLSQYFSEPEFGRYFLNIIGLIHFTLPGVFADNPEPYTVNASLWTIPYELECYIALMILASTGLLRRIPLMLGIIGASWLVFTALLLWRGSVSEAMQSASPGRLLVVCFLAGNVVYLLRRSLRLSADKFVVSAVLSYALLSRPETAFLSPLPVAYLTACIGLTNPPKIPVLMDGDYSYGLYLFAFPIQQTYSALFPNARIWALAVPVAACLSLGYAYLSWNLVEKPILAQRKKIVAMIEGWVSATPFARRARR